MNILKIYFSACKGSKNGKTTKAGAKVREILKTYRRQGGVYLDEKCMVQPLFRRKKIFERRRKFLREPKIKNLKFCERKNFKKIFFAGVL